MAEDKQTPEERERAEKVALTLKKLRERAGLTQQQLADLTKNGVSRGLISKIEHGGVAREFESGLKILAKALGDTEGELLKAGGVEPFIVVSSKGGSGSEGGGSEDGDSAATTLTTPQSAVFANLLKKLENPNLSQREAKLLLQIIGDLFSLNEKDLFVVKTLVLHLKNSKDI